MQNRALQDPQNHYVAWLGSGSGVSECSNALTQTVCVCGSVGLLGGEGQYGVVRVSGLSFPDTEGAPNEKNRYFQLCTPLYPDEWYPVICGGCDLCMWMYVGSIWPN